MNRRWRVSSSRERRRVEAASRGGDLAVDCGAEERLACRGLAEEIVPVLGAGRPEAAAVGSVAVEGGGGPVAGVVGAEGAGCGEGVQPAGESGGDLPNDN